MEKELIEEIYGKREEFIKFLLYMFKIEGLKDVEKLLDNYYDLKTGDPYGNRTHDSALRGLRRNRLTNGPFLILNQYSM